jgi:hypothetical protein
MSHSLRPIIPHFLKGKPSRWNNIPLSNEIDLAKIKNVNIRRRFVCLTDKSHPWNFEIEYYAGTGSFTNVGHIWMWVPNPFETVVFRYTDKYLAENDLRSIYDKLNNLNQR